MKISIASRLADALESGEYRQIRGLMRREDMFCPLGILCDLHSKEAKIEWGENKLGQYTYLGYACTPPIEVITWAGIKDAQIMIRLREWNDYDGLTFKQIAAKIRSQIENARSKKPKV